MMVAGEDRRQIQTAVLGGPDSYDPLILPLEALDLASFRKAHAADTFWCGRLLGGCGEQLSDRLYFDRVCHFAHHGGAGTADKDLACRRRARGVSSADHLYVRAAAAQWLGSMGEEPTFGFPAQEGAPVGSVVDITWQGHRLRVHLDQALAPVWEGENEPVLGMSVPVDSGTLIDRWYVHRIRLETSGTGRTVSLGTEAFARTTQWFGLPDCELGEHGLFTPAVREIIRSRRSHRPGAVPRQDTGADRRGRELLRRLADAQRIGSVVAADLTCAELADHIRAHPATARELAPARGRALRWAAAKRTHRHDLFAALETAIHNHEQAETVVSLVERIDAEASRHRTDWEEATARAARSYLANSPTEASREAPCGPVSEQTSSTREQAEPEKRIAEAAAVRARYLLRELRLSSKKKLPRESKRRPAKANIELLVKVAATAGGRLSPRHRREVEEWKKAAGLTPRRETPQRPPAPVATNVPCEDCDQPAGRRCKTPRRGPHASRVRAARKHAHRSRG